MEDAYYLEAQVLTFLSDLVVLKKPALTELVFHLYSLCFNDEFLKKFVVTLIHSCCKKLMQQAMTFGFSAMNYLSVVYEMVSRDKFKAAWL